MDTQKGNREIDLKQLFWELFKRIWIIVLATCIVGVLTLIISMFILKPSYQSTTSVYILGQQKTDTALSYSDVQLATQLTSDYEQLIKSRNVLEAVIVDLGLQITPQALASTVTVSTPVTTRILEISVMNGDPYLAQKIADKIRVVAGKQIVEIMRIDAVNLVDAANFPTSPSSPNIAKNTVLGALIGFLLACAVIVLTYVLNDTIRKPEDIENFLGLSVLAVIPLGTESAKNSPRGRVKKQAIKKNETK